MVTENADLHCDALIIGGGAAGLFCALTAGKRGKHVIVLEHQDRVGKKILVSGGGRCNFTHLHTGPQHFYGKTPDFHRSALARYHPSDFLKLVEHHGIAYFEKTPGQLFCQKSSRDIVQMLVKECLQTNVEIFVGVSDIHLESTDPFRIRSSLGVMTANACVIATGGLSFPSLGASDFAFRIAEQFKLPVIPPRPALVPLLAGPEHSELCRALTGLSVPVKVSFQEHLFQEPLLFTHRGFSGPAILQISTVWKEGESLEINWLPELSIQELITETRTQHPTRSVKSVLELRLPQRLPPFLFEASLLAKRVADLRKEEMDLLHQTLHHWKFLPAGTEGYKKAEVTRGGVDTRSLSSQTMEVKSQPGLYFIGEAVDITGQLGGFNFQWAWASARAAGEALSPETP